MTTQFQEFIQECLIYLNVVAKGCGSHSNTAVGKFWRALLSKVYEILDKVNALYIIFLPFRKWCSKHRHFKDTYL